jgi:hypothetical protein
MHWHKEEKTMSVMLITYEHGKISRMDDPVPGIIKGYNHIQLSESTYAIESHEKTRTIFNKIMPNLGKGAHLLIVTPIKPFSGSVLAPVSEWFSKHLPEE